MNLRKIVIKSKENDYEDMAGTVESMRNINRHIRTGTLPDSDFSLDDLEAYIHHLISIQEKDGSWTVSSEPENLTEDERIEFITFPSFLAFGTLVLAEDYLPQRDFEGRDKALEKSVKSLSLEGYGEDALFQIMEMVLMFIEAGVIPWLEKRKETPVFHKLITELVSLRRQLWNRMETGDTILPFGGDYRPVFELVSSGLSRL